MNMQHRGRLLQGAPVKEYGSAEEMRAHAKALRDRLMGPPPKPRPVLPIAAPIAPPATARETPAKCWILVEEEEASRLAKLEAERAAAVEAERLAFRPEVPDLQVMAGGHRQIIRAIATRHGISVAEIKGHRRNREVVAARQQAMAALWVACPHLSLPQIGRLMGGKDHTTVLHAVRKLGAWKPRAWPLELWWLRDQLETPAAPIGAVEGWNGEGCA